ncbi:helix-turn-helix transcriptional regulator [Kamptonema animale CS-326]|jgi:transcriptional regulator with XRE-family HTH domain|uniref:helix-turn-helix domain-containing protein n=1 Tax=Kamptonema animale TaxID=92934 RepID=UPI00232B12F7|nr:helix-turn-helix transcriptional regulator [Kamptonema animale]MDB9514781.1 helix-turn-helix transcriptional regulator [Kamptonema animale CS-326]
MVSNKREAVTLDELMAKAGLTEPELSRQIGVGLRIINDWKRRRKIPRLDNALALSKALGVSLLVVAEAVGLDVEGIPPERSCISQNLEN